MCSSSIQLPASIMELNMKFATPPDSFISKKSVITEEFDDIQVERRYKREISLPGGIENWNIDNFDTYLNFDENAVNGFEAVTVPDDGIVPEGDQRPRCPSISSVSSFHDEIRPPTRNCTVKTLFSTIRMDSGSTCISSDYSFASSNQDTSDGWLDPEETCQNLDRFLQEVPEMPSKSDAMSVNSLSSPVSEATMEFTSLHNYSRPSSSSFDSFAEKLPSGMKRRLDSNSEDDVFITKQTKQEFKGEECRYVEIRRKNNLASKNCRKTRKEKQREMEQRVTELEQEKETLRVKVQLLEELIQANKTRLLNAIVQRR